MRPLFVLIKCELGKAYQVAEELVDKVPGIAEVHSISGEYDLLAKFNVEEVSDIGHFVCEHIQTLAGIRDTFTIPTNKAF